MTNNEPNVKLTIGSITQLTEHGIEQTTDAFGEITKNFVKVQAQHMDAALRAKLIELGWTPPGGIALNTPAVGAQGELPFAWYLRTGHGNAIHFGTEPPDCLLSHEWKPVYERPAPTGVYAAGKVEALVKAVRERAALPDEVTLNYIMDGDGTGPGWWSRRRNELSEQGYTFIGESQSGAEYYCLRGIGDEIRAALAALAEGEKGNG